MSTTLLVPGQCGEEQCIPCGIECPVKFYISCCHLYWYLELEDIPETDYLVTIDTPDGPEYYFNISSGIFENANNGTYTGSITVDSIESESCEIEVPYCTDDPCLCCIRVEGINTKITRTGPTFKMTGAWYFPTLGWAGQYSEGTLPDFSHERYSQGYRSSGAKTEFNCYNRWGFPGFSDFLDVPLGSGHIDFWTGIRGYEYLPIGDRPTVACSIPTEDFWYQRIYYDYFLRYTSGTDNGPNVAFWATRTSEDFSSDGSPIGDPPTLPTFPSSVNLTGILNLYQLCPDYDVFIHTLFGMELIGTGIFESIIVCDGTLDFTIESWPDVIPL